MKGSFSIFAFFLLLLPAFCLGQNLVINPGFENTNDCSSVIDYSPGYTSFPSVTNWVSSIYQSTPDYYNLCNGPGGSVPLNFIGTQPPHSGNAYAGCYALYFRDTTFSIPFGYFYNEYLATRLSQPLQAGHDYYISFYVSLAEGIPGAGLAAIDDFGAYISNSQVYDTMESTGSGLYCYLDFQPQIKNTPGNYLADTINWMKIQGVYTAAGNEQWLTLGHFGDSTFPDRIILKPSSSPPGSYQNTYMYIDDVCVLDMESPIISSRDTLVCPGLLPVTLHGHAGGTKFQWSNGDTSESTQVIDSGLLWVETWGACIYYVDTINVGFLPIDTIITSRKDMAICKQSFPLELNGNLNCIYYKWNTGDTTQKLSVLNTGLYWVVATDKDCRQFSDTFNIATINTPVPELGRDSIYCNLSSIVLATAPVYSSYLWNTGATANSISVTQAGTYYLQVTDSCGTVLSDSIHIGFASTPEPGPLADDTLFCKGQKIMLTASTEGAHYIWNTGDTSCCITADTAGHYSVIVSNQCGIAEDSIDLSFDNCDNCYFIPSAFTPNGDGRNDIFRVLSFCHFTGFHMLIVNRWGEILYNSFKIDQAWDGTQHGIPVEVGTYFYMVELSQSYPKESKVTIKGDVTVIR